MSEFIFRLTDWTAEGEGWNENITKSIHELSSNDKTQSITFNSPIICHTGLSFTAAFIKTETCVLSVFITKSMLRFISCDT